MPGQQLRRTTSLPLGVWEAADHKQALLILSSWREGEMGGPLAQSPQSPSLVRRLPALCWFVSLSGPSTIDESLPAFSI
jgi:hypothetical protein